ncbi:hypothetical protein GCM10027059_14420 [Myceligenerans halotolerans]
MTFPQSFALFWGIAAVVMGTGWVVFARRFADRATNGPEWLWIQHSWRTNFVGARVGGVFFIIVGCVVGGAALAGVLT